MSQSNNSLNNNPRVSVNGCTVGYIQPVPQPGSQGNHFGGGNGPRWKQGGVNQSSHYMSDSFGVPVASVNITVGSISGDGIPVNVQHGHTGQSVHVFQGHTGRSVRVPQGHTGRSVHVPQGYVETPVHVPQGYVGTPVHVHQGFVGTPVHVHQTSVGLVPVVDQCGVGVIGVNSGATIQYGNGSVYGLGP